MFVNLEKKFGICTITAYIHYKEQNTKQIKLLVIEEIKPYCSCYRGSYLIYYQTSQLSRLPFF